MRDRRNKRRQICTDRKIGKILALKYNKRPVHLSAIHHEVTVMIGKKKPSHKKTNKKIEMVADYTQNETGRQTQPPIEWD